MGNDSSGRWDIILLLAIVFAAGTAFGRFVTPLLLHNHSVLVIHGSKPAGCRGPAGFAPIRFGTFNGSGDASYEMECNELSHESYNLDLLCDCNERGATEIKTPAETRDGK